MRFKEMHMQMSANRVRHSGGGGGYLHTAVLLSKVRAHTRHTHSTVKRRRVMYREKVYCMVYIDAVAVLSAGVPKECGGNVLQ